MTRSPRRSHTGKYGKVLGVKNKSASCKRGGSAEVARHTDKKLREKYDTAVRKLQEVEEEAYRAEDRLTEMMDAAESKNPRVKSPAAQQLSRASKDFDAAVHKAKRQTDTVNKMRTLILKNKREAEKAGVWNLKAVPPAHPVPVILHVTG